MRILRCMDDTIDVLLSQCAASVTAAKLSRHGQPDIPLLAAVTPSGTGTRVSLILDPSAIPLVYPCRGVWKLYITACKTYSAPIWVDACPPPAFPATDTADDPRLTDITVNCAPTIEPDLTALHPVIGFHAAQSTDGIHTGIDTHASPPYGAFLDPPPAPPFAAFKVASDGTTLVGNFYATTLPSGTPFALYDAYGFLLISGTITVISTTGSFSVPLALSCADYYLAINP